MSDNAVEIVQETEEIVNPGSQVGIGCEASMKAILSRIWEDQTGVATVEYALLLAVAVVGAVAVWSVLCDSIANAVSEVETTISS